MKCAYIMLIIVASVACKKEASDGGEAPKAPSTTFKCPDKSMVVDYQAASGDLQTHVEIGCDGTPYFRGTITKNGNAQPIVVKLSADDLDGVWNAVAATNWSELPKDCGDTTRAESMVVKISLHDGKDHKDFDCKGALLASHAKLVDAVKLVAPDQAFSKMETSTGTKPSDEGGDCASICKLTVSCDGWSDEDGNKLEGEAAIKSCVGLCDAPPEGTTFDVSKECLQKAKSCDDLKKCEPE